MFIGGRDLRLECMNKRMEECVECVECVECG
jgi:hypothetical protein